jgi:ArsR family transcriptional regulator, virulence genes transcriptional regulator
MVNHKEFNKETYEANARVYKLLANAKRLEILKLLGEGEMTVTNLVNTMGIRKANVSQHLAILRYLKLVSVKRVGKNAFYTVGDPRIAKSFKILNDLWKTSKTNI